MSACKLVTACLLMGLSGILGLAQAGEKLPVLETFKGTVTNDKKPDLKTGFIATEADWKAAWGKINPEGKAPAVDFAKHFLLVSSHDAADPNRRFVNLVKDAKGILSVTIGSTLIGFEPSNQTVFEFYKVSREGVTGVRRFDPVTMKMVVEPLSK